MPEFRTGPVTVRPPATSANLGPGFDAFGLALELRDEVTVEAFDDASAAAADGSGLSVEVLGEGAGEVPLDERHLLVRSLRAAFDLLGGQPAGLRVRCVNRIPHGRGLGSSSAAICAGLVAARALVEGGDKLLDDEALLDLATRIEGHPDNVAPCLAGGLTIAWTTTGEQDGPGPAPAAPHAQGPASKENPEAAGTPGAHEHCGPPEAVATRAHALRLDPVPELCPVVFIPAAALATAVARGLLPAEVPHRDAAFNAGRAGLLVAALTQPGLTPHHRSVLLYAGTRDRLHQGYRAPAMPDSAALVEQLSALRIPAAVSGAGPTVLALAVGAGQAREALEHAPADVTAMIAAVAAEGVVVQYRAA
ncbi:MAG TPA: homoserine kinase [Actinocrinis sp.]|nr:homoserine kinase [Actinocrinis sp.]